MRLTAKSPATMVSKFDNRASVLALGRKLFFAVLLPSTCDFAIYFPYSKTAKYGAVFGGTGVKIYSK